MDNGNAHQSEWSQQSHAERGDTSLPCPAADLGGHVGNCKAAHPRGIIIDAAGRWRATPAFDPDDMITIVEHYA